jgi:arylamine N-acetyltransferase
VSLRLDGDRVDAYLARLGVPEVQHDVAGLAMLQSAHLMSVPFHNLLLLASDGRFQELPALQEVVDDAIAGVGGVSDRTTPPFAALLKAVGFDAQLAAATVQAPGDHLVCVVKTGGQRFLCDVGNGHPYLRPWALDGALQEQSFHGWTFRFDPLAPGGPTLRRVLPNGSVEGVYVVDPTPRAYNDFAPTVGAHYMRAGAAMHDMSLRATCIQPDAVLTLEDEEYVRHSRFGRSRRRVAGRDSVSALLTERFGLCPQRVRAALHVVSLRRPELFAEPRWFSLGRGMINPGAEVDPPAHEDVPDILVCFATVGRQTSARLLLETLSEEVRESRYPGKVGVLVVENHDLQRPTYLADAPGFVVHRVPISALRPALDRAARLGVLPALGDRVPVPIGAAREAQVAAIRAHLDTPIPGLPHPAEHPVVVWMVDDDVAFQQVDENGRVGRHTHLLYRAARYWSALPGAAVVLGTFTGDPPIPALDGLGGQLRDLVANAGRLLELGPRGPWAPPPAPPPVVDAYYDLSESADSGRRAVWPYAPTQEGASVRSVALTLLTDLPRLLDGQQLTRPLLWDGRDTPPAPSLRRGGNALFLDVDALFRWPTPVLQSSDGVLTRRADTVWAALASAENPGTVVEATLPLRHVREGQSPPLSPFCGAQASADAAAQVRGVVLARSLADGRAVARELPARELKVTSQRRELCVALGDLRAQLARLADWGDAEIDAAIAQGAAVLDTLERYAAASEPPPGQAIELEAFLDALPRAIRAWRGAW